MYMTRKMYLLMAILAVPFATFAQNDDMYFVSSKKKVQEKNVASSSSRKAKTASPWDDAEEVDYHSGSLRDVDEYNRRGGTQRQVMARLQGDTLYVDSPDSLQEKEYLLRYEENYAVDEPYNDDYYFSTRLSRYHGFYHYDPFMWDVCFGWYDPWYDPWYGFYGPYYRHGWFSWYSWGWGWGHCHLGWHHGWGPGWHHGWAPAAPPRPHRPGGSAVANGGGRPGGDRALASSRGGRNYATASRGGIQSSRQANGSRVVAGTSRNQRQSASSGRYVPSSRGNRSSYSTPSRSTRNSSSATYSSPSRSNSSSGFSGGSRGGGGFSGGGGSRGGGGRGGR